MVAQYFDNVWLYTKDITQKYNADNRLDFGVSKELVSKAIQDFGVKLYQNNFSNKDLYTAFLGITPSGSLFPFPEITSTTPVPTGFEFVDTLITATNDIISMDDVNKSLYKRIYHNIPYLLKSKGTIAGLRAYHQYANLKFYPDYNDASKYAQAYLPFFDGGFWSCIIIR